MKCDIHTTNLTMLDKQAWHQRMTKKLQNNYESDKATRHIPIGRLLLCRSRFRFGFRPEHIGD